MSRRQPSRRRSVVQAPEESAGLPDESPLPPPVAAASREAHARSVPDTESRSRRVLRGLWSATKLASGVLIVVCASVAVAWGAHHYALSTPRFSVRKVEIDGNRRKSDADIVELAGLQPGQNIFALDLANAQRRLLTDPWIKEATISRKLPGTLKVELSEREPAALASIGGRLYLVTPTGEPFKEVKEGDPTDLPVVTGMDAAGLARNRKREIQRVGDALAVLRHYQRLPLSKVHPAQEAHLTAGGDVILTVGKDGIALHLGRGPWKKKLLMAARVIGKLRRKGRVPGIVFLDNQAHPERVVVRMR